MTNVVSALTARTQFGQIMRRASQKNERFLVDRRGQPAVIIMSIKDYIDTIAPTPDWLKSIGDEAKRKGLNKLSMRQIDAEIAASRRERREKAALTSPAK
ncbi:MAG TPA: type II toxin-antitoxin system Phd/YefM family antitoxin [Bryobacteraceae bacterium]|nr:type II toxin-antitoxin system Phd/YefM family antitoxin [Bryobacteraceae bacterium]